MIASLLLTFWNTGWLECPISGSLSSISWYPSLHVQLSMDEQCHKLIYLTLAAACCAALVAAAQQQRRQHNGPAGCRRASSQAVGYEHALQMPLFRSEHGGSPTDDAWPGARMQIGMAMQEPAWTAGPQFRWDMQLDIQMNKWDIPLDRFGHSVG